MAKVRNLKYGIGEQKIVEQPYFFKDGVNHALKKWIHNGIVVWENGEEGFIRYYPFSPSNYLHVIMVNSDDTDVAQNYTYQMYLGYICNNGKIFIAYSSGNVYVSKDAIRWRKYTNKEVDVDDYSHYDICPTSDGFCVIFNTTVNVCKYIVDEETLDIINTIQLSEQQKNIIYSLFGYEAFYNSFYPYKKASVLYGIGFKENNNTTLGYNFNLETLELEEFDTGFERKYISFYNSEINESLSYTEKLYGVYGEPQSGSNVNVYRLFHRLYNYYLGYFDWETWYISNNGIYNPNTDLCISYIDLPDIGYVALPTTFVQDFIDTFNSATEWSAFSNYWRTINDQRNNYVFEAYVSFFDKIKAIRLVNYRQRLQCWYILDDKQHNLIKIPNIEVDCRNGDKIKLCFDKSVENNTKEGDTYVIGADDIVFKSDYGYDKNDLEINTSNHILINAGWSANGVISQFRWYNILAKIDKDNNITVIDCFYMRTYSEDAPDIVIS